MASWHEEDVRNERSMYESSADGRDVLAMNTDQMVTVLVKKYTEDHEWIEMDEGDKIGQSGTSGVPISWSRKNLARLSVWDGQLAQIQSMLLWGGCC